MNPALTLVVLTEDAGASGWAPVHHSVRALCDRLIANVQWTRVQVVPRDDASPEVLRAVGANRWRGGDGVGHALRTELARYIANQLLAVKGETRVVFFHFDSDRPLREGTPHTCDTAVQFERFERIVRATLLGTLQRKGRAQELDALMARLHLLVPSPMLEAWLYQRNEEAQMRCLVRCDGRHAPQWSAWTDDPRALEDVAQLKGRRDLHCLEDRDKEALARRLDARALYALGGSFAANVDRAAEDGALLTALIATGTGD